MVVGDLLGGFEGTLVVGVNVGRRLGECDGDFDGECVGDLCVIVGLRVSFTWHCFFPRGGRKERERER